MHPQLQTADRILARIAWRQHGLATRRQLLEAGLSSEQVRTRVRRGTLLRVHRGVYRVGHAAPSLQAHYLAAVLARGKGALLGNGAAAHLMEMTRGPAPTPEVLCPTQHQLPNVVTHHVRSLSPQDGWHHQEVPCTTPARTLVDLAAHLTTEQLARAAHEAGVRYRTTPRQVEAVLARFPNATGAANLRAVTAGDSPLILSRLESGFLRLLRRHRLSLPLTNRPAGGFVVDCRWPERKLTVELNSYRFHNSRHAWERDHRREREAYARGDAFRRYTWTDVFEEPAAMLKELRNLL